MPQSPPLLALVDDDDVRLALERLVISAGFAVESFASGAEFLKSVDDHEPACVVLDLHMPEVNGFDIQVALARHHSHVPVVVITGHDTAENRIRARRFGAQSYLCKPVDGDALLAAIDDAIDPTRQGDSR